MKGGSPPFLLVKSNSLNSLIIILPNNRANGLVKNSFNFNTRYDKTNTTQILA